MSLVRKKNCRSPATTKTAFGLGGLVKLHPQRKRVKKKAVSLLSVGESSHYFRKNGFGEGNNSVGLDKPTPAMLEVLEVLEGGPIGATAGRSATFGWKWAKAFQQLAPCEPLPITSLGRWLPLSCADLDRAVQTDKAMHPVRRNTT
ncbi:hypothetical protein HPB50_027895 [Hyalomma asiaticum]|nr:hypothetical protein HPB50_027895 [Hyalomma asiaticum]